MPPNVRRCSSTGMPGRDQNLLADDLVLDKIEIVVPSRCSTISFTSLTVSSGWTSSVNVRSSRVRTKICISPTNSFYLQEKRDRSTDRCAFKQRNEAERRARSTNGNLRCVFLLQLFISTFLHYLSSIGKDRPISSFPLIERFLPQKQRWTFFGFDKRDFFLDANFLDSIGISPLPFKSVMQSVNAWNASLLADSDQSNKARKSKI